MVEVKTHTHLGTKLVIDAHGRQHLELEPHARMRGRTISVPAVVNDTTGQ